MDRRVGVVAQLVERVVRNDEVRGSIPLGSTTSQNEDPTALGSRPRRPARVQQGFEHLPHFHHVNGVTVVSAYLDGDRRADFTLELTGQVRLGGQDFLL